MRPATNQFEHFDFLTYRGEKQTKHLLVFYRDFCIQHIFSMTWENPTGSTVIDLSDHSAFVGKHIATVKQQSPQYTHDLFHGSLFFFDCEPDPIAYVVAWYALLIEWTCDNDYSVGLLPAIRRGFE